MIRKGFYFSSKIEKNKGDRDFKTVRIIFIETVSIQNSGTWTSCSIEPVLDTQRNKTPFFSYRK